MSGISVCQVKFNVEFTSQEVKFSLNCIDFSKMKIYLLFAECCIILCALKKPFPMKALSSLFTGVTFNNSPVNI